MNFCAPSGERMKCLSSDESISLCNMPHRPQDQGENCSEDFRSLATCCVLRALLYPPHTVENHKSLLRWPQAWGWHSLWLRQETLTTLKEERSNLIANNSGWRKYTETNKIIVCSISMKIFFSMCATPIFISSKNVLAQNASKHKIEHYRKEV